MIIDQILQDLNSDEFYNAFETEVQKLHKPLDLSLKNELSNMESDINKLMNFILETDDPNPFLRKVETLEKERIKINEELERKIAEHHTINHIDLNQIKNIKDSFPTEKYLQKEFFSQLVNAVYVDKDAYTVQIEYRIGNKMASPKGFDRWPVFIEHQKCTQKVALKFIEIG